MMINRIKPVILIFCYLISCITIFFSIVLTGNQKVLIIIIMTFFLIIEFIMLILGRKLDDMKRKVFTYYQFLMSFLFIYTSIGVILSNYFGFFDESIFYGWQEAVYSIPPFIALIYFITKVAKIAK